MLCSALLANVNRKPLSYEIIRNLDNARVCINFSIHIRLQTSVYSCYCSDLSACSSLHSI